MNFPHPIIEVVNGRRLYMVVVVILVSATVVVDKGRYEGSNSSGRVEI